MLYNYFQFAPTVTFFAGTPLAFFPFEDNGNVAGHVADESSEDEESESEDSEDAWLRCFSMLTMD